MYERKTISLSYTNPYYVDRLKLPKEVLTGRQLRNKRRKEQRKK